MENKNMNGSSVRLICPLLSLTLRDTMGQGTTLGHSPHAAPSLLVSRYQVQWQEKYLCNSPCFLLSPSASLNWKEVLLKNCKLAQHFDQTTVHQLRSLRQTAVPINLHLLRSSFIAWTAWTSQHVLVIITSWSFAFADTPSSSSPKEKDVQRTKEGDTSMDKTCIMPKWERRWMGRNVNADTHTQQGNTNTIWSQLTQKGGESKTREWTDKGHLTQREYTHSLFPDHWSC